MRLKWTPPSINKMTARHTSGAEHSSVVVFGGYRTDGSVMPARDFFSDAIAQTDFDKPLESSGVQDAFKSINEDLHENIKTSIQSEKWEWNRTTYRRSGEVVGTPRDIVDAGKLLNSQSWEVI
jgi:hypothetical protein